MQLLQQPNRWSCLITSAAMVLDCRTGDLIDRLGHDGSQILWPTEPEPLCRKGFQIEEIQYLALRYGRLFAEFMPKLCYAPKPDRTPHWLNFENDYHNVLKIANGIMLGTYYGSDNAHAVAWNAKDEVIHDPAGRRVPLDRFNVETFYACVTAGV